MLFRSLSVFLGLFISIGPGLWTQGNRQVFQTNRNFKIYYDL